MNHAPTPHSPRKELPRGIPENHGVSSQSIVKLIDAFEADNVEMHSLMILKDGHVIAEAWWAPYEADIRYHVNSVSKSFVGTAVGLAIQEKLVDLEDTAASFFPEEVADVTDERALSMTVRDLLTMCTGHDQDATVAMMTTAGDNWVKGFFQLPVPHAPGTFFQYNSAASYILAATVQKAASEGLVSYLTPRLLEPLGITEAEWLTCPRGVALGGAGLMCTTEDMARLGQLYLQGGLWNGAQLLSTEWVSEATRVHVDSTLRLYKQREPENNDYAQGYGYHFWMNRFGSYRASGAFSQFILVLDKENAVVVITAHSTDSHRVLDKVWSELLPALQGEDEGSQTAGEDVLAERIRNLQLTPVPSEASNDSRNDHTDRYLIEENELGVHAVTVRFSADSCQIVFTTADGSYPVDCGIGHWQKTVGAIPVRLRNEFLDAEPATRVMQVAASGGWQGADTFVMAWHYLETPDTDAVTMVFDGERISLSFRHNRTELFPESDNRPTLVGTRSSD